MENLKHTANCYCSLHTLLSGVSERPRPGEGLQGEVNLYIKKNATLVDKELEGGREGGVSTQPLLKTAARCDQAQQLDKDY